PGAAPWRAGGTPCESRPRWRIYSRRARYKDPNSRLRTGPNLIRAEVSPVRGSASLYCNRRFSTRSGAKTGGYLCDAHREARRRAAEIGDLVRAGISRGRRGGRPGANHGAAGDDLDQVGFRLFTKRRLAIMPRIAA